MLMKDRLSPAGPRATIDPSEIEKFTALAEEWWNPNGKFHTVHAFNAARRDFLFDRIARHFGRTAAAKDGLDGLSILDVGCGAGLLCEPLAARGAEVVGIDATARNIEIARWHAAQGGHAIHYRHALAEDVVETGERYDVVLNMEVIEHVSDPARLMQDCARLVKPGGMMVVATLNRTLRSFGIAIVGAEYILGWLPKGTHDWRRFLKPAEIEAMLTPSGLAVTELAGASFSPLSKRWRISRDPSVNYLMVATRE